MKKQKKYSEYVGKKFGELTILSISEPVTENNSQRICKCKCSCGKEVQTNFSSVLFGNTSSCGHLKVAKGSKSLQKIIQIKRANKNAYSTNQSTGVKYVHYYARTNQWVVDITVDGVRHRRYVHSLQEAIEEKARLLNELGMSRND